MIRVLQVFANLNRGGAETMIMNYYRAIDKNRVQFDFVSHFNNGAYEDEIKKMGGNIFRIPRFKGYNVLSYLNAWNRFFKNHPEYTIIHVHCFKVAGLILFVAKRNGVKTRIVHSHIANAQYKYYAKIVFSILNRIAISSATHLYACGESAGKFLFSNMTFKVLKNAIDSGKFIYDFTKREKIREGLGIDNNLVIGHVGRFSLQKNHKFIIEVFEEIYKINNNARLILVGTGDKLLNEIKNLVSDKKLNDAVIFTGVRSDIPELMMAMDVFLFPSLYEGLPVTVIEAQAAGLRTYISDRITNEVVLTPLVTVLSLHDSPDVWAKEILKESQEYERRVMSEFIIREGYDIYDSADRLMNFYLNNKI